MLDKASANERGRGEGARATVGTTPEAPPTVSDCRFGRCGSYLLSGCGLRIGLNGWCMLPAALRAAGTTISIGLAVVTLRGGTGGVARLARLARQRAPRPPQKWPLVRSAAALSTRFRPSLSTTAQKRKLRVVGFLRTLPVHPRTKAQYCSVDVVMQQTLSFFVSEAP